MSEVATSAEELVKLLADLETDRGKILPPPIMSARKLDVGGESVAVIEVVPSPSPPVRYNGQVWIRVGPRRALAWTLACSSVNTFPTC
ncbi:MAG TPA: hypothetical protein VFZ32_18575 [Micromonosporaceae bacterium]